LTEIPQSTVIWEPHYSWSFRQFSLQQEIEVLG